MIVRSILCAMVMAFCTSGVVNAQDCADGEVPDYFGNCAPGSWVGDGYCDGDALQYGFNLCCYELDGGDCTESDCALSDCSATTCGDGVCEGAENDVTCPEDCIRCGDGVCHATENALTCPSDCQGIVCGDGVCESPETYETCPEDCAPCPAGATG